MYRPVDDLMLEFSYMLLTNVHAEATYRFTERMIAHAGYDWLNFGRPHRYACRAFFDHEYRVSSGLRYVLTPRSWLDLTGGYVFDRFYFQGRSLSDTNIDRIDLVAAPFCPSSSNTAGDKHLGHGIHLPEA